MLPVCKKSVLFMSAENDNNFNWCCPLGEERLKVHVEIVHKTAEWEKYNSGFSEMCSFFPDKQTQSICMLTLCDGMSQIHWSFQEKWQYFLKMQTYHVKGWKQCSSSELTACSHCTHPVHIHLSVFFVISSCHLQSCPLPFCAVPRSCSWAQL